MKTSAYKDPDYQKNYYHKNKDKYKKYREKYKEKTLEYYQKNKDKAREKYINSNPRERMLRSARARQKKYGTECTITIDDIIIPRMCPYLNIPLTFYFGKGSVKSNVSLDRIDPSKGYIPGNVQVISFLANMMKSNATVEQLLAFSDGIQRIHGQKAPKMAKIEDYKNNLKK